MVAAWPLLLRRAALLGLLAWFLAADAKQLPWDRLDPVRRAQVLMALLGLLLLGFLLIMLVLVGGRYARRLARQRPANRSPSETAQQPKRSTVPWAEDDNDDDEDGELDEPLGEEPTP
jgi:hypothetical protein